MRYEYATDEQVKELDRLVGELYPDSCAEFAKLLKPSEADAIIYGLSMRLKEANHAN